MAKVRTFIDSGVLIAACRGIEDLAERAMTVLDDPARVLVASDFVLLEVLPKAKFHRRHHEAAFYETFFGSLTGTRRVRISRELMALAMEEATQWGLSAVDALHIAAAKRANCSELYTAEKTDKPLFRVTGLVVRSIR